MIKLGLTGNRYSGKDKVSKVFEQIGIPVFHADVILKFLLNHNFEISHRLRSKIGDGIFNNDGSIESDIIKCMNGFDRLLDEAEFELFKAYEKFRLKNKQSIYCIFHSSILFERGWDRNMDYITSVYSQEDDRIARCNYLTQDSFSNICDNISSEIKDIDKNTKSNYIVYNYSNDDSTRPAFRGSLLTQVSKIDQNIINKFIQNEHKYQS